MLDSTVLIRIINITMFLLFEIYMQNVCSLCCIAYFLICVTSSEDYGYPQGSGHPFLSMFTTITTFFVSALMIYVALCLIVLC